MRQYFVLGGDGTQKGAYQTYEKMQEMSSKPRGPNPNKNSLIRKHCCKRRMESIVCRCALSYSGVILRVRVPLFASEEIGWECAVVGVPKTIDNDINLLDRSFGFDTAMTEANRAIDVAYVEARVRIL